MIEQAVTLRGYEQSDWLPFRRKRRLRAAHGEPFTPTPLEAEDKHVAAVAIEESDDFHAVPPTPGWFPLDAREDCRLMLGQLLEAGHLDERGRNRAAARLGFRAGLTAERARRAYDLLLEHQFAFRCRAHDQWFERTQPIYSRRTREFLTAPAA